VIGGRPILELLRRGWRRPPAAIARWAVRQARAELDQMLAPARARRLDRARLLAAVEARSLDELWLRLQASPFAGWRGPVDRARYARLCPGDEPRVLAAAERALMRRVDLLGSGPVDLGRPVDWHKDYKSGIAWPMAPFRRLDLLDLRRPSDVKFPWEVSRLQWLVPAGQAYLLTGDERYAEGVRDVVVEWAAANPVAVGVNWACTMDVALRGIALVWLFHACARAAAWRDDGFRLDFLRLLYVHGDFASRHLEWSDVNGNHLAADAAGLVFLGLFFGRGRGPEAWQRAGWRILAREIGRQVDADGVDFEGSCAYHRLALELFLLPALFRMARGLAVPDAYRARLRAMARFVAAYSREDGSAPLWGDADDGRALPFGGQHVNDHRYLAALVGLGLDDAALIAAAAGPPAEAFWLCGPDAAERLGRSAPPAPPSARFPASGVHVMRGDGDHVFIDCGPVGFAGRGGHGHNDCLSFEAALAGVPLIADCGAFVYSASVEWRNRFRGTAFHNTPMIDGEEQNRFPHPEALWSLRDDARPTVIRWETGERRDVFAGSHAGYLRLARPVRPIRGILLDKSRHALVVADAFEGEGAHAVSIPYHLAPGVEADRMDDGSWRLRRDGAVFLMATTARGKWTSALEDGWCSPSYGVKRPIKVLRFEREGPLAPLSAAIVPAGSAGAVSPAWFDEMARLISGAGAGTIGRDDERRERPAP
jgi:uncharacterized heparinase superfamily protein